MPGGQHPSGQGQHPKHYDAGPNVQKHEEKSRKPPPGRGAPRRLFSLPFPAFLQFWAVILSWMMMMAGD